jgi:SOS-response transcriptional repressor LexA
MLSPHRLPYLGTITAGRSAPLDYWPIVRFEDVHLLKPPKHGERLAMCRVIGDSLKDDGILDGDYVIFRMSNEARPGDLVIAHTPFGATLKYYWPTPHGVWLRGTSNGKYDQLWIADDIRVQGVVTETRRIVR